MYVLFLQQDSCCTDWLHGSCPHGTEAAAEAAPAEGNRGLSEDRQRDTERVVPPTLASSERIAVYY